MSRIRVTSTKFYYVWVSEEVEFDVPDDLSSLEYIDSDTREKYEVEHYQATLAVPYVDPFVGVPGIIEADYRENQDESWEVVDEG